jgi:hypothetical protein
MSVNAAIAGEGHDDIAFATAVGFRALTRVRRGWERV